MDVLKEYADQTNLTLSSYGTRSMTTGAILGGKYLDRVQNHNITVTHGQQAVI